MCFVCVFKQVVTSITVFLTKYPVVLKSISFMTNNLDNISLPLGLLLQKDKGEEI